MSSSIVSRTPGAARARARAIGVPVACVLAAGGVIAGAVNRIEAWTAPPPPPALTVSAREEVPAVATKTIKVHAWVTNHTDHQLPYTLRTQVGLPGGYPTDTQAVTLPGTPGHQANGDDTTFVPPEVRAKTTAEVTFVMPYTGIPGVRDNGGKIVMTEANGHQTVAPW